jgi:hypothetical protein
VATVAALSRDSSESIGIKSPVAIPIWASCGKTANALGEPNVDWGRCTAANWDLTKDLWAGQSDGCEQISRLATS